MGLKCSIAIWISGLGFGLALATILLWRLSEAEWERQFAMNAPSAYMSPLRNRGIGVRKPEKVERL